MRPPVLRIHADEQIVDLFAGGGGASLGIEMALGRSPDLAINHDPEAIAMHQLNHPRTHHLCGNVWDVAPRVAANGRAVGLLWASPDCTHFSKAKGGKPKDSKRRALAWVIVRWAREVRPRIICMENVEEWLDWGPLNNDGQPDKSRMGLTFRIWLGKLRAAGYHVEWRELRACDYGAPTTRKRLFLIARCDGQPIVWPSPTHGPGARERHRVAADCIEWALPCPSIFDRAKPLADKTLRRIARGIDRFVLRAAEPFLVPVTHVGDERTYSTREPIRTITAAHRGELAFVAPTLIQTGYGERDGQAPRSLDLHRPLGTVMGGGQKHALVAAFLAKHFGDPDRTSGGGAVVGSQLGLPMGTVTTRDHHSLVATSITKFADNGVGHSMAEPLHTAMAGAARFGEVRAFLTRYNGVGEGQSAQLPLGTVTTRDRFGLVRVHGADFAIADIGLRMLSPRELFRAQGFPDRYVIDRTPDGAALTKTAQIRLCGNSVCPPVAAAIVGANLAGEEVVAA